MINDNSATEIQNPVFELPPLAQADHPIESPKDENYGLESEYSENASESSSGGEEEEEEQEQGKEEQKKNKE